MQSQYPDWLAQLAADGQGPLTLPAIVKGDNYDQVLRFEVDWSADTFTCDIRTAPDAGAVLQAFTVVKGAFSGGIFDVTLRLTPAEVATVAAGAPDGNADGISEVFFSLQRTSAGKTKRVLAGNIPISAEV